MDGIKYVYQANQGVSGARNAGIRAALGDLIAFLDSDDLWHPRKLEIQLHYLDEHPEVGFVGAISFCKPSRVWPALPEVAVLPAHTLALEDIVVRSPFQTSSVLIRKQCFDRVGYFDSALRNAEDRDLYIRLCNRYPGVRLGLSWSGAVARASTSRWYQQPHRSNVRADDSRGL